MTLWHSGFAFRKAAGLIAGLALLLMFSAAPPARADEETVEYLTVPKALAEAFPEATFVACIDHPLDATRRAALRTQLRREVPETSAGIHLAYAGDRFLGYAAVVDEIGKFKPITFLVAAGPDRKVSRVLVMVYRESVGDGVRHSRFTRQFTGKSASSPLRANKDILHIAGATMSCNAICAGVRRALALFDLLYPPGQGVPSLSHAQGGTRVLGHAGAGGPAPVPPPAAPGTPVTVAGERPVMGTLLAVTVRAATREAAEAARSAAFEEVERWDLILSNYKPDSPLSKMNAGAGPDGADPGGFEAPKPLISFLQACADFHRDTNGAFDPTIGACVRLWRKASGGGAPPSDEEILAAKSRTGWTAVHSDAATGRVRFDTAGLEVDPGALGKGWALDHAGARLRSLGVQGALLNFGGQILALGTPGDDAGGWPVRVDDPAHPGRTLGDLRLKDASLSVSGSAERFTTIAGRPYSHILDPRTGRPVPLDRLAAVLAPTATEADAWSTAAAVLGAEAARPLIEARPGLAALLVGEGGGAPVVTKGWPGRAPEGKTDR